MNIFNPYRYGGEGLLVENSTLVNSYNLTSNNVGMTGLYISNDGVNLYYVNQPPAQSAFINQYEMSTPYDVTTLSFVQRVGGDLGSSPSPTFKPDGTKMFFSNFGNNRVLEYDLSTAWDVSTRGVRTRTAIYTNRAITPSFNNNGSILTLYTQDEQLINYNLNTNYLTTSFSSSSSSSVFLPDFNNKGFKWWSDGLNATICNNDIIYQIRVLSPYDISNISTASTFDTGLGGCKGVFVIENERKMYVVRENDSKILEYDL